MKKILSGLYIVLGLLGGLAMIVSIPSYSLLGPGVAIEILTWGGYSFLSLGAVSALIVWKKISTEAAKYPLTIFALLGIVSAVLAFGFALEGAVVGVYAAAIGIAMTALFKFTPALFDSSHEPSL